MLKSSREISRRLKNVVISSSLLQNLGESHGEKVDEPNSEPVDY